MIKVRDVIQIMENWAPSSLAENWDNAGLITGDPDNSVTSVMVTLEVTEETIAKACKNNASLLITHHPPIFKSHANLTGKNMSTRVILKAVREDISIYTAHTNLDQAPGGVSWALAETLGLGSVSLLAAGNSGIVKFVTFSPPDYTDRIREAAGAAGAGFIGEYNLCSFTSPGTGTYIPSTESSPYEGESGKLSRANEDRLEMIVPAHLVSRVVESARKVHPYEEMAYDLIPLSNPNPSFGYGAVGDLVKPMNPQLFTEFVVRRLCIDSITVSKGNGKKIQRVAVMGGSGKHYISHALASGADAYVTGEIGHHDFIEYGDSIMLIDATHRATELPVLKKI
ncbi:Nif3-like dinuclear metal center hexameric protein, partial [Candidatus Latescibacterota bacterium]